MSSSNNNNNDPTCSRTGKFIGGATARRNNAAATLKKRPTGIRILNPIEREAQRQTLPPTLSPMERFYASLLRSTATDFVQQKTNDVPQTVCSRVSLPFPTKLTPTHKSQRDFYAARSSLVLEEARFNILEGIRRVQQSLKQGTSSNNYNNKRKRTLSNNSRNSATAMTIKALLLTCSDYKEKTGHTLITFTRFDKTKKFTHDEMQLLRQGTVLALYDTTRHATINNIHLALVLPQSREDILELRSFKVMVFQRAHVKVSTDPMYSWDVLFCTSLLTEQRQFESCVSLMTGKKLPFIHTLIGGKQSCHLRFRADSNGEMYAVQEDQKKNDNHDWQSTEDDTLKLARKMFQVPSLNHTQEQACQDFLHSSDGTLSLVQGPPGTGKTTLILAIICRYVAMHNHHKRRLLITAPTNKATMILCSSFLEAIRTETPPSIVLVGEEEKLFEYKDGSKGLRSVFLYTWIETVVSDLKFIARSRDRFALRVAKSLHHRVSVSLRSEKQVITKLSELVSVISDLNSKRESSEQGSLTRELIDLVQMLLFEIGEEWEKKREQTMTELLANADIIFCTCATAGSTILKRAMTQDVDDLIVDEAAASTEPLMAIPFNLCPKRVLAVGDPAQLPAMVSSPLASELGLSMSLHERLMGCGHSFTMLNVQYRMSPEISSFASREFYSGLVFDGENVKERRDVKLSNVMRNGLNVNGPYSFIDVFGRETQNANGSFFNRAEAEAVQHVVANICRTVPPDHVRVITFYSAQAAMIKGYLWQRRLGNVNVSTVDSFQGSESDVVVVSIVRTGNYGSIGFLSDRRRLNVSLTRARMQLIVVGNATSLKAERGPESRTIHNLVMDAFCRNLVLRFPTTADVHQPMENSDPDPRKRRATHTSQPIHPLKTDSNVTASVTNTTSSSSSSSSSSSPTSSSSSSSSGGNISCDDSSSDDSSLNRSSLDGNHAAVGDAQERQPTVCLSNISIGNLEYNNEQVAGGRAEATESINREDTSELRDSDVDKDIRDENDSDVEVDCDDEGTGSPSAVSGVAIAPDSNKGTPKVIVIGSSPSDVSDEEEHYEAEVKFSVDL